ncbi:MAG: hypothetical protein J6N51_00355 [Selenomonas sp.]|nr:hypothetical protein [Selenomonas sp.]
MKLPKESTETPPPIAPEQLKPSYLKPWEDLTIADDYMFKLVMSHKHICQHLLEWVDELQEFITKLKTNEREKANYRPIK